MTLRLRPAYDRPPSGDVASGATPEAKDAITDRRIASASRLVPSRSS
ncbi:MAG: hypothetical protein QOI46_3905, partial [Alphaproteobacteria bacterium]|nr:hypothetical protein [Alphaproteobacteria bacterium]